MATHEGSGVLSDTGSELVSNTDFRGFDSENSPHNNETTNGDSKLSEFIRNLPGLPSNNPLITRSNTDVVSCDAASGPLEDNSELNCAVKSEKCDSSNQDEKKETEKILSTDAKRTEEKSKERHSRHRSSRDCRKCYERRKTKRCNVGVQCKIDRHLGKSSSSLSSIPRSLYSSSAVPHWEHHKYASLIKLETYPNGNASILHMCQDEIDRLNLNEKELSELANEFLKVHSDIHCRRIIS